MSKEYEIISHSKIRHINLALNRITYRSPHAHREFELILCIQGNALFLSESREISCPQGNACILNPNETHSIQGQDGECTLLILQIAPEIISVIYPEISHIIFSPILFNSKSDPEIISQIYRLSFSYFEEKPFFELYCTGIVYNLFSLILKKNIHTIISEKEKIAYQAKANRLHRILNYANQNFSDKISLSALAHMENLSPSYLSHIIKKSINCSFQEYIALLRVHQAEYLILNTRKSMLTICEECGYSDYRYMYQAFIKKHNCSPKAFRKSHPNSSAFFQKNSKGSIEYIYEPLESLIILKEIFC